MSIKNKKEKQQLIRNITSPYMTEEKSTMCMDVAHSIKGNMYMLTNGIKVKFIMEDMYGFKKGDTYDATYAKSKLGKMEVICIKDSSSEEYAYPKDWFQIEE